MRALGPLLIIALLSLGVGLRWQAWGRATRLMAADERALQRTYSLYRASRSAVRRGPHPGLASLLTEHPGLSMLPELGDAEHQYARDAEYMYGLTRPARRGPDGESAHGYILRSWPLRFGVSGDLEYYADDQTGFWFGQNELGRSGTSEAFPPPFPQPDIAEGANAAWWQTPVDDNAHR